MKSQATAPVAINGIRSIGWLNCANGSVNLTPVFNNSSTPVFVNISKEQFKALNGNKDLMKELALKELALK